MNPTLPEILIGIVTIVVVLVFALAPTAFVFATARRVVRPRNVLPTVKLTIVAFLFTFALALAFGVEFSGGFVGPIAILAVASPITALVMVGVWALLVQRVALKARNQAEESNGD
jgi:hypothetical protein